MLKHFFIFLTVIAVLFSGGFCEAKIITAASPSFADVSTAVAQADPGDTVTVAAGTAVWTSNLFITKDIQLIGAGIDQTIIVDEVSRATKADRLITWLPTADGAVRLSGFTFQGGATNTANPWFNGTLNFYGVCSSVRVDHCKFNNLFNENIYIEIAVFGVIDHCQFYETNWVNGVEVGNGRIGGDTTGHGDVSWATPVQWGQTNNYVYIESCAFKLNGSAVDDFTKGSRVVFRYNIVTNAFFQDHGTESSQRDRSGRAFEVYGNTFIMDSPVGQPNVPLNFRGGSGVVFSNIFSGFAGFWSLENFRAGDRYSPWGSANGQNSWDSNNPAVLATGTHTGADGSGHLTDDNATWTVNQWVGGYELQNNALGGTNSGAFGMIYSNSVHDIYYMPSVSTGFMKFTGGQTYQIYQSYAQLDQVGRGQGDLITDISPGSGLPVNTVTGLSTWPNQASEGVYQWGNTFNGTADYTFGPNNGYCYAIIQQNRDYFDNTPKPGYTPLVFPHPLAASDNPGTGGGTIPGNGSVVPPADLQAHPPTPH